MKLACKACGVTDRNKFDQCAPCKRISNAKHRTKTRQQAVERTKRWMKEHPEERKAHAALYRLRHLVKVKFAVAKATAAWRLKNVEKVKLDNAKWYANHPEARRLKNHNRQVRLGTGKLSIGIIEKLTKLQRGYCPVCFGLLSRTGYHIDHIISLAAGGQNEDSNVQLLCPSCNMQKHSKDPIVFMRSRGFLL
jgi:5-methylcytosine-specific restriction endonuclease McrA